MCINSFRNMAFRSHSTICIILSLFVCVCLFVFVFLCAMHEFVCLNNERCTLHTWYYTFHKQPRELNKIRKQLNRAHTHPTHSSQSNINVIKISLFFSSKHIFFSFTFFFHRSFYVVFRLSISSFTCELFRSFECYQCCSLFPSLFCFCFAFSTLWLQFWWLFLSYTFLYWFFFRLFVKRI